MALLDVSEVISDPLFTSDVTLIPRVLTYDEDGNPVYTDASDTYEFKAVVTQDSKTLARYPDSLVREGSIVVRYLVNDAPEMVGKGYDRIEWRGKSFVIRDASDYTQFGRGFIRLLCVPEDADDGSY